MTVQPRETTTLQSAFLYSSETFKIVLRPQQIWEAEEYSKGFYYLVRRNDVELMLIKNHFENIFKVVEE